MIILIYSNNLGLSCAKLRSSFASKARPPAQAVAQGENLELGRAHHGLVPDFKLRLPTPEGLTDQLAELKFIGVGVSW